MWVRLVVCGWVLVALAWPLGARAAPSRAADETSLIARNLVENILGKGLVRTSRITEDGRSIEMVWESATYKPAHTLAHTRELLQVEAEFAAAAVFRVLSGIQSLQFEIVKGKRSLCNGRAGRDRPLRIEFAQDLGR